MFKNNKLKERRVKLGLTQVELAIKAGVTGNTYRNWELGSNAPSPENYKRLKKIIGDIE